MSLHCWLPGLTLTASIDLCPFPLLRIMLPSCRGCLRASHCYGCANTSVGILYPHLLPLPWLLRVWGTKAWWWYDCATSSLVLFNVVVQLHLHGSRLLLSYCSCWVWMWLGPPTFSIAAIEVSWFILPENPNLEIPFASSTGSWCVVPDLAARTSSLSLQVSIGVPRQLFPCDSHHSGLVDQLVFLPVALGFVHISSFFFFL